jgi:hypothetical protein
METNQTPQINRDLIKSAGENLKWIGYLIFLNVLISVLIYFSISESRDIEEIKGLTKTWSYISFFSVIVMGILFIYSGKNLIDSFSQPNENYGKLNKLTFSEEVESTSDGMYLETECFPNGKIRIKKSFNKEGLKHGVWEHYLENGTLDFKELYENGNWVKNIRN